MKRIVLIGDSIRMGYQETVRTQLDGWADVWGPDENGGTSVNIMAHLDEWILLRTPDMVHINCGLHDLKREFGQGSTTVPLSAYADNVRAIITRVKAETAAVVVWALTTPVNQEWHHNNKPFDRFEADVKAYNAVAADIARELDVVVNDLFAAIEAVGRDRVLQPDGVHFTAEGYTLLGRRVADTLKRFGADKPGNG